MKCLVTGADGLLGSAFRKALGNDRLESDLIKLKE